MVCHIAAMHDATLLELILGKLTPSGFAMPVCSHPDPRHHSCGGGFALHPGSTGPRDVHERRGCWRTRRTLCSLHHSVSPEASVSKGLGLPSAVMCYGLLQRPDSAATHWV